MKNLVLPRGYLSYSAATLFEKDIRTFRETYYENKPKPSSAEMLFGKEVAELLESKDENFAHVPRLSHPEYQVRYDFGAFTFLAYLDSCNPETGTFYEYKTSRVADMWNDISVRKHKQLDVYSLLLKKTLGKVNNTCKLVWLETKKEPKRCIIPGTNVVASDGYTISLTGRMEVFERTIKEWERKKCEQWIKRTARAIAKDYKEWKQNHDK